MLDWLHPRKSLVPLLCATISTDHLAGAPFTASDHRQTSSWISSNHTYQKYPRLRLLEQCDSLRHLKPLLAYALVSGLFRNPFVSSRFLYRFCTPDLPFAAFLFSQIDHPNLFSWNTLIRALSSSQNHPPSAALSLYVEMLHRGPRPDNFTLPFLLKSCRSAYDLDLGRGVHSQAIVLGFLNDPFVHTAVTGMYLHCGCIAEGLHLFDEMPHRDVVSWTSLISGLVDSGYHEQAVKVFSSMRSDGDVYPNVATVVSAMSACANLGSLSHTKSLHGYAEKAGLESYIFVSNSLINAYAKCGRIACAGQVFEGMGERDLHSWTAMISGLASHGLGKEAVDMFVGMLQMGVEPDSIAFIAVLSACSHVGMVEEGIKIFNSMEKVYAIPTEDKHFGCMVDLFSRAGLLDHAYEFIMSMPTEPNLAMLGALLSSCRVRNDLELGELVAKKIDSVCRYQGGAHVLLSNMYANENQWQEVVSVREVGREQAVKPPGGSWVEVRGVLHEFVVGDRSHPLAGEIHMILDGFAKLMEGPIDPPLPN